MSRGGAPKKSESPERKCIVSGQTDPKSHLVRFVVGPDSVIVPDILNKLPGRGVYVTASRSMIETAGQGQFSRSAKQKVTVPDDLVAQVEGLLLRRVVELLSLARKAGLAVCGFEKVKAWLGNDQVRVLLQASDGSERGKTKLWTPTGARYFGCLSSAELGLAFGRQSVIHGALSYGGLSDRVVEEATKLRGIREIDGGDTPAEKDTRRK